MVAGVQFFTFDSFESPGNNRAIIAKTIFEAIKYAIIGNQELPYFDFDRY